MVSADNISKALADVRSKSKKRKFTQSIDLAINLRDLDMNKPENKFNEEVALPNGRGKPIKVAVIAEGELSMQAKTVADRVISKEELEALAKNKKAAKKLAREIDFFVAQIEFMPLVGKYIGSVLGPRGKMPKPVPPNAPLQQIIERLKKTVRVRTKEKPIIHVSVGTEDMEDKKIIENVDAVLKVLERKLEKGTSNIKSIYMGTTMGASVRLEV